MDTALWLSIFALVVAGLSMLWTLWTAIIEQARRRQEVEDRRVANVTARVEDVYFPADPPGAKSQRPSRTMTRFALRNGGPAVAYDIDLELTGSHRLLNDGEGLLPVSELAPGEEHHLPAALSLSDPIPIPVIVAWRDGRGERREERKLVSQQRLE
jgi:hypothetical protein